MGIQTKTDCCIKKELKIENKSGQNKNYMSDAEQQELTEYLKKFGIDLP